MSRATLLTPTERGLYCEAGDFYIDPWQPVARAILTHAHGDHARRGSRRYLVAQPGERVFRTRLGLAALFAYRMSRLQPVSFSMVSNDYGFELLSPTPLAFPCWWTACASSSAPRSWRIASGGCS